MKKFLALSGVIALATAFGLTDAANAKPPDGVGGGPGGGGPGGGGPGGGGPSSAVSEFSSPFCASPPSGDCEVADSTGKVNSLGAWEVHTKGLDGTIHDICLDAVSAPVHRRNLAGLGATPRNGFLSIGC